MSKNVWIDLTDLFAWRGHFTGIQRVTYEYAVRYKKDGAKFLIFDPIDNRFVRVELDSVQSQGEHDQGELEMSSQPLTRRRRLRRAIGRPYYSLSDEKRAMLHPYVYAANHTVRGLMHYVAKKKSQTTHQQNQQRSPYSNYEEAVFEEGDMIVLLGAGWNDSRVLDAVIDYKKKCDISISQHINDILPIYQPQLFADELPGVFVPYVEKVVKYADLITVISKATKRDIEMFCEQHGDREPDIEVVRLGDNAQAEESTAAADTRIVPGEFLLSVGTFEVRKNYTLLYQAVKLGQIEEREIPVLVIAGRRGWLSGDIRHMLTRDPFVRERIVWLENVSDSELRWLYQNCMFTIFPSVAEGWGLPVAESLNYGKLCLTSGTSAMLEIGKGMVDYFLPYDARECMEKIQYYIAESRYKKKNDEIAKNYTPFTWDESYQQMKSATDR